VHCTAVPNLHLDAETRHVPISILDKRKLKVFHSESKKAKLYIRKQIGDATLEFLMEEILK